MTFILNGHKLVVEEDSIFILNKHKEKSIYWFIDASMYLVKPVMS